MYIQIAVNKRLSQITCKVNKVIVVCVKKVKFSENAHRWPYGYIHIYINVKIFVEYKDVCLCLHTDV